MADLKQSWADDDVTPSQEVIHNDDGTKTVTFYRLKEDGNKVKVTQKVKAITTREKVDHNVAERKKWAKYGREKGRAAGPNTDTTSLEPDFQFKLSIASDVKKEEPEPVAEPASDAKISCRTCNGLHFTSRCPYKDTLGVPEEERKPAGDASAAAIAAVAAQTKPGKYVSPHLRAGAAARTAERSQESENTTLRVSNLSEDVSEPELRDLFGRFGRVVRCHVVKDRETQRNRGFAFVSYEYQGDAEKACARLNGYGLDNLIMRVEFSKK